VLMERLPGENNTIVIPLHVAVRHVFVLHTPNSHQRAVMRKF
jgi:hypothetical protein